MRNVCCPAGAKSAVLLGDVDVKATAAIPVQQGSAEPLANKDVQSKPLAMEAGAKQRRVLGTDGMDTPHALVLRALQQLRGLWKPATKRRYTP